MTTIQESALAYEDWLRKQLDGDIVEADLVEKHDKMCDTPFVFLRATYWRWAETIFEVCPELADGASVLGIGDIHLENFGTWRDADGRLAWGVNDFDEAAEMPYMLDLVRLATSTLLGRGVVNISDDAICAAILEGYRQGLRTPKPIVLDRDQPWLRERVVVSEKERAKFWEKMATAKWKAAPKRYRLAMAAAMPERDLTFKTAPRSAGTGSLGRPRWIGVADWRGAPVVREAKALVTPAWSLVHKGTRKIRAGEVANGRYRPIDPWYRIKKSVVVRRLSPNNRKIEVDEKAGDLFTNEMLTMMGFELANVHLGVVDGRKAIDKDLNKRKSGWLVESASKAAGAVAREHEAWRASHRKADAAKVSKVKPDKIKREKA